MMNNNDYDINYASFLRHRSPLLKFILTIKVSYSQILLTLKYSTQTADNVLANIRKYKDVMEDSCKDQSQRQNKSSNYSVINEIRSLLFRFEK